MKSMPLKLICACAAAGIVTLCGAAPVTPRQALLRLGGNTAMKLSVADYDTVCSISSGSRTALYLFSSPGKGYIVAPADDAAPPLLGYSDQGYIDRNCMPPAMEWWLEEMAAEVVAAAENGMTAYDMPYRCGNAVAPMLSTRWDQGEPYNDLCPQLDGKATYTGCTATAMAQAMNHFRHPAAGSRSVAYSWHSQTLSMDFAATRFDWDNMADEYSAASPDSARLAVATLMKACGYAILSNYGTAETSAVVSNVVPALVKNLGYARSAMLLRREFYPAAAWQDSIHASLASGSPVIYTGQGSAGGHAFVCDGYDGNGYFHFNWGWSGKSDGWFLLSALNPEALGTGGGAGGFNSSQSAVTRLRPAYEGAAYVPVMGTAAGYAIDYNYGDNALSLTGGMYNYATSAMNYSAGFSIEPLSGGEKYYVGAGNWNLLDISHGYNSYSRSLGERPDTGVYRVKAVYQYKDASGTTSWYDALVPVSAPPAWILTVTSSGASIQPENRDVALCVSRFRLRSPAFALRPSMNISVEAEITNSGTDEADTDIHTALYRDDADTPAAILDATHLSLLPSRSLTYSYEGTLPASLPEGKYTMYIVGKPYGADTYVRLSDSIPVEILPSCPAITLAVPQWSISEADAVNPDEINVDMTLTCRQGCFADKLMFYFMAPQEDGTYASIGMQRSGVIWLNEGDTASCRFTLSMPQSAPRTQYRLLVNYKGADGKNKYLCRETYITTGISDISAADTPVSLRMDGTTAIFVTERAIAAVECYGIDGRRMSVPTWECGEGVAADLTPLSPGIYILRCLLESGERIDFKLKR